MTNQILTIESALADKVCAYAIRRANNPLALEGCSEEEKLIEAFRIIGIICTDKPSKVGYSYNIPCSEEDIEIFGLGINSITSNDHTKLEVGGIQNRNDKPHFIDLPEDDPARKRNLSPLLIQKVNSYGEGPEAPDNLERPVTLNCPQRVLNAFQELLKGTRLLGSAIFNPYSKEVISLPPNPEDLTAWHLQILARNEQVNTTGKMKTKLYQELLTDDQIARLRCLVKATNVTGMAYAEYTGGYGSQRVKLEHPEKTIVVDQSGLQWQKDFRNTGGMFFYPSSAQGLPENYANWQNDMYMAMYGQPRPKTPSGQKVDVVWNSVPGELDLDQVQMAIESEFTQALDAVVAQAQLDPEIADKRINFKFLKAGMGFFADGVAGKHAAPEVLKALEKARLEGILKVLKDLKELEPTIKYARLGKIGRIELPFSSSNNQEIKSTLESIKTEVKKLGLEWGGAPNEDAFKPRKGFINATTNCGDPHAMIGNEGPKKIPDGEIILPSVDACLAYNAYLDHLNVASNSNLLLELTPDDKTVANTNNEELKKVELIVNRVVAELEKRGSVNKSRKIAKAYNALSLEDKKQLLIAFNTNQQNEDPSPNLGPKVQEFVEILKIHRNIFGFGETKSSKQFREAIKQLHKNDEKPNPTEGFKP